MSQAWKNLERTTATALGGRRKVRGDNFAVSDFDVEVDGFPHWKVDAKYRSAQPWKHHGYVEEIAKRYCNNEHDVPILVTKNGRERGAYVTMRLNQFGALTIAMSEAQRALREALEELAATKAALQIARGDR